MGDLIYFYWNSKQLFPFQEFLVLWFIFNVSKLLLVSIVNELLWPTQFFNRRHNIGYQVIRYRTYTETLIKLRKTQINNKFLLKSFYKYEFLRFTR